MKIQSIFPESRELEEKFWWKGRNIPFKRREFDRILMEVQTVIRWNGWNLMSDWNIPLDWIRLDKPLLEIMQIRSKFQRKSNSFDGIYVWIGCLERIGKTYSVQRKGIDGNPFKFRSTFRWFSMEFDDWIGMFERILMEWISNCWKSGNPMKIPLSNEKFWWKANVWTRIPLDWNGIFDGLEKLSTDFPINWEKSVRNLRKVRESVEFFDFL